VTADAITDLPAAARAPRVGCGDAPALLLVDFARGWTEPTSPFALDCDSALAASERLLAAARGTGRPVVFATVAYDELDLQTVKMLAKTPRVKAMRAGSPATEVDARLAPGEGELVLVKKHASAFFGTHLASFLISRGIDTLLIGGCITSGCVRATAVDAAQHGYRALVVADACADRTAEAHAESLRSIDDLYGDVVALDQAEACLHRS
jgi:nicotinamidase-related amidase